MEKILQAICKHCGGTLVKTDESLCESGSEVYLDEWWVCLACNIEYQVTWKLVEIKEQEVS
ncbi:MAG: hypothetical protein DRI61_17635 [Chloroflexi bacterium]|nr:MAG: hypothetical protein DRI61_17635 [Chloroflexota bacterium]